MAAQKLLTVSSREVTLIEEIKEIRANAIKTVTPSGRELFCFSMDAKKFMKISSVAHAHRDSNFEIKAYQRPQVKAHIKEISEYFKTSDAILPNSIVVALMPEKTTFAPYQRQSSGVGAIGELVLKYNDKEPAAVIIDGQQRTLALKESGIENFPIFVTAIRDADEDFQRQQFVNVNSAKPLPKNLIFELLPYLDNVPKKFSDKALPALITERIATRPASPFFGLVRLSTGRTDPEVTPVVEANSFILALAQTLKSKDRFFARKLRQPDNRKIDEVCAYQFDFWRVVKEENLEAWGLPARQSRLMHGAGIWGMTFLADEFATVYRRLLTQDEIRKELAAIRGKTAWTSADGLWKNFDGLGNDVRWNEMENTVKDKNRLAAYLTRKWRMGRKQKG